MYENYLPWLQFRHVHKRLPRGQGAHRHRSGVYKVQGPGLCSHFPFLNRDVIGPTAAESWVTVNGVADFKLRDIGTCLLYDACDIVARDERQMRSKFARVFAAERKRISWINAARDHTHQRFVFVWLRSWHFFKFQHFRCAILMRDHGLHHWLFVGARGVENCENREAYDRQDAVRHLYDY